MLAYLLRQRRWLGFHVNDYASEIRWLHPLLRNAWGLPAFHFAGRLR